MYKMNEQMKKKRGGQAGNQNTRSHGYYSNHSPVVSEQEIIDSSVVQGVDEEIVLVRVKLKRVLEKDPDNISAIIRATSGLCRLLRLKARLA